MQDQHKHRGDQQHGPDQGQMPNRNRTGVQEAPEKDMENEGGNQRQGNQNQRTQNERNQNQGSDNRDNR